MKSVIAHRCSGWRLSANDGIGVPLSPVLIVLKMSSRVAPPRKVQLWARSAARIAWPASSFSVGADDPSPRPSVPWHLTQPVSSKSFFPSAMVSLLELGAPGRSTGLGTFPASEKSAENVVRK